MEKLLPEICNIQYGYAFDSAKFSTNEGVPLIRIRDVVRGYSETYTTEQCGDEYIVRDGDMLIGMDGEFNIARWNGGKAYLNQRICRLIPTDDVDSLYLFYFMPKALKAIEEKTPFVTVKHLSAKELNKIVVPLPELEEQREIALNLQKVDNLISLRKQQLAKLDELVKARFVELFGSAKHNHQGYPVVKIGSCAKLQGGFAFKSSDYLDDGIRLVQISNVNKDTLDWDSINCVPQSFLQKYKDFELHVGDLVLAMTRPVIKSLDAVKIATVSEDDVPSLLNQRVGRFVIDKEKLNSVYLMLSCQMPEFREYVEAMSGNSLQPNISSKQVEDYSIVLPPLALQEQFAAFVEQTDKSKLTIQQSLDELETLKKALMQKYFG